MQPTAQESRPSTARKNGRLLNKGSPENQMTKFGSFKTGMCAQMRIANRRQTFNIRDKTAGSNQTTVIGVVR
jgi:hypothetical protein